MALPTTTNIGRGSAVVSALLLVCLVVVMCPLLVSGTSGPNAPEGQRNTSSSLSNLPFVIGLRSSTTKPRVYRPAKPTRPHVRGHSEQCWPGENNVSPPPTNAVSHNHRYSQCAFIYVCFHSSCRCPLGHAHLTTINQTVSHQCAKFANFRCQNDTQCQDIDANVVCGTATRMCRCRSGFSLDPETGYCKKTYTEKYKMQSLVINMLKMNERNAASTAPVSTTRHQFFEHFQTCKGNGDCRAEYTYCHRGRCKCWPEFQFVPNHSGLLFNTTSFFDSSTAPTNDAVESVDSTNATTEDHSSDAETAAVQFGQGYCVRRLCQFDAQCATDDNPNLVCNNTICECRYGYIMYKETKVCMKYVLRRQSCDLTCRIIGGLFASIFMLTLIYWCFYCCYSIVKNYRAHRLQATQCPDSSYYRNMYHHDFEPIDYERYLSANSLARNSRSPHHNNASSVVSRFPVNLTTFLRIPLNDDPPSYTQAMADESLPDYDAVMELQQLRKAEDKPD